MLTEKIQKIIDLQFKIKEIELAIKDFNIPSEGLKKLKEERSNISKTIKELEVEELNELEKDENIRKFREQLCFLNEDLAKEINEMYEEFNKDGKEFKVNIQTEDGMKIAMGAKLPHVFVGGKEIKNRTYQQKLF